MLLTRNYSVENGPTNNDNAIIIAPPPTDSATSVDSFLRFWKPGFVIWTEGQLQPTVVDSTAKRNIPMGLIAAEEAALAPSAWQWLKGSSRATLRKLEFVFARDAAAFRYIEGLKLDGIHVALGGPLLESAVSLSYNEADRAEMAELLLGRPVWLAAHLHESELPDILTAHRDVTRYSHRALLIVVPDQSTNPDLFLDACQKSGLRTLRWSDGEIPEEATQIVLADVEGELGLWYRLAPISFMGNSLLPGMTGSDPNEPAAHGSAILHGPHLGQLASNYARFSDASAARRVTDAKTLTAAVTRLLPPDQCAAMAHAAWEVASRGAALNDMVVERILDHLDQSERRA